MSRHSTWAIRRVDGMAIQITTATARYFNELADRRAHGSTIRSEACTSPRHKSRKVVTMAFKVPHRISSGRQTKAFSADGNAQRVAGVIRCAGEKEQAAHASPSR